MYCSSVLKQLVHIVRIPALVLRHCKDSNWGHNMQILCSFSCGYLGNFARRSEHGKGLESRETPLWDNLRVVGKVGFVRQGMNNIFPSRPQHEASEQSLTTTKFSSSVSGKIKHLKTSYKSLKQLIFQSDLLVTIYPQCLRDIMY